MDQVVHFRGTISWPRFRRAQWAHLGARWAFLFVFPVAMTAYAYFSSGGLSLQTLVVVIVVASAFVAFMLAYSVFAWRRVYARSPLLHKALVGSVSRDRFVVENDSGRTELTWDQFVRIREGKDFVLLYQAPNLFNIIAREFFDSDAAWETARRFAMSADAFHQVER